MDVFDLDRSLVEDYARFARSFTQIRASDIETKVEEIYATRRFWPEPLISLNPHFERDVGIDALAAEGSLHSNTATVFRDKGQPITLYRHQAQSIAKAAARQSFVVTTGTGSGKSLCFFVPIIDAAIRARVACGPVHRNLSDECTCEQSARGIEKVRRSIRLAGNASPDFRTIYRPGRR